MTISDKEKMGLDVEEKIPKFKQNRLIDDEYKEY